MRTLTTPSPAQAVRRSRGWAPVALLVGSVATVVLLLAGAVVALTSATGTNTSDHAIAPLAVPVDPGAPSSTQDGGTDLILPQPTTYTGGIPTGYPNTQAGAVAAAYGYSRIATGLDVAATLRTAESIADPSSGWFLRERSRMADGLVAQRKTLGLPATGPTGMALVTVTPSGYRVDPSPSGMLTVLTLNVVDTETADGTMGTGTIVFRWNLRWDGARWVVTKPYLDPGDAASAVAPLTSAAEAKGWKAARGG
jgi:hypothetical protein